MKIKSLGWRLEPSGQITFDSNIDNKRRYYLRFQSLLFRPRALHWQHHKQHASLRPIDASRRLNSPLECTARAPRNATQLASGSWCRISPTTDSFPAPVTSGECFPSFAFRFGVSLQLVVGVVARANYKPASFCHLHLLFWFLYLALVGLRAVSEFPSPQLVRIKSQSGVRGKLKNPTKPPNKRSSLVFFAAGGHLAHLLWPPREKLATGQRALVAWQHTRHQNRKLRDECWLTSGAAQLVRALRNPRLVSRPLRPGRR